jgi:hypothetical protein
MELCVGEGKYKVCLHGIFCGKDAVITIYGGEVPHVGAVAVALPRPSIHDRGKISSTASVICVTGHKEDEIAKAAALKLSAKWNCVVTVSAGVHIDHAVMEEIEILKNNIEAVVEIIGKERLNQR